MPAMMAVVVMLLLMIAVQPADHAWGDVLFLLLDTKTPLLRHPDNLSSKGANRWES
jgi:hypothetical protein